MFSIVFCFLITRKTKAVGSGRRVLKCPESLLVKEIGQSSLVRLKI